MNYCISGEIDIPETIINVTGTQVVNIIINQTISGSYNPQSNNCGYLQSGKNIDFGII